ncbi:MAG: methyltransferase domain-containing protein [Magnetospirillum sp.]|nr:methyltransferase domain-containing protein [Magnetospirillum sp.]
MVKTATMSVEEAFRLAAGLAAQGDHDQASGILRQLHAHAPDDVGIMRALGVTLVNSGDLDGALPFMQMAAQRECSARNVVDFVKLLRELRRIPDIVHVCDVAWPHIGDDPELLGIWAYACLQMAQLEKSLNLLDRALAIVPDSFELWHNRSAALVQMGRGEEAVSSFRHLARPWDGQERGRDLVAEYAALAPSYDDNSLHGSFTRRLLEHVERAQPGREFSSILELGCGSGMLAGNLKTRTERLVGIDLSPDMLRKAEATGRYQALHLGDLVAVLEGLEESFAAVLAASVLYFLPDLKPIFAQVSRCLAPGGIFAFSVDPTADDMDIGVVREGEYCHSRRYLRGVAASYGFSEVLIEIDNHRGAAGFFCTFAKPA